jgi:DNA-binding IclR family transcriptional regulator
VVLAMAPPEVVERYVGAGMRRFTSHTITDPDALRDELREVRRRGYAADREEFDDDFCCIAAPVLDPRGRFLAAIGISMTQRAFDDEHETLAQTVIAVARATGARAVARAESGRLTAYDIARFQASSETRRVLDLPTDPSLVSPRGIPVP